MYHIPANLTFGRREKKYFVVQKAQEGTKKGMTFFRVWTKFSGRGGGGNGNVTPVTSTSSFVLFFVGIFARFRVRLLCCLCTSNLSVILNLTYFVD